MDTSQVKSGSVGGRALKQKTLELLASNAWPENLDELLAFPPKQVINPLFSLLLHSDEIVRCRAVSAMGQVVAHMAKRDMEAARNIVRRLMWSLNDESGGIGWGAPEAMAEIMACHSGLAEEYASVFISYLNPNGNFLEYEALQRGLLRGLLRVAAVYPDMFAPVGAYLSDYLDSGDSVIRGLAAWSAGLLKAGSCRASLEKLTDDRALFSVYVENQLTQRSVKEVAAQALLELQN